MTIFQFASVFQAKLSVYKLYETCRVSRAVLKTDAACRRTVGQKSGIFIKLLEKSNLNE